MTLLFKDYTVLVENALEERRTANKLSKLLLDPKNANIRQEFVNVYNEKIQNSEPPEENTLRSFFGIPPRGRDYAHLMGSFNADKFRPLQSLIRKEIKNPNLVTVELLAWLINFKHRPFISDKNYILSEEEKAQIAKPKHAGKSIPDQQPDNKTVAVEKEGTDVFFKNLSAENQQEKSEEPVLTNVEEPKEKQKPEETEISTPSGSERKTRFKDTAVVSLLSIILAGGAFFISTKYQNKEVNKSGVSIPTITPQSKTVPGGSKSDSLSISENSTSATPPNSVISDKKNTAAVAFLPGRCQHLTKKGLPCKSYPLKNTSFCRWHTDS